MCGGCAASQPLLGLSLASPSPTYLLCPHNLPCHHRVPRDPQPHCHTPPVAGSGHAVVHPVANFAEGGAPTDAAVHPVASFADSGAAGGPRSHRGSDSRGSGARGSGSRDSGERSRASSASRDDSRGSREDSRGPRGPREEPGGPRGSRDDPRGPRGGPREAKVALQPPDDRRRGGDSAARRQDAREGKVALSQRPAR